MGRNCNYSHDWSVVEKKADRCWICGSLQHRKGECPVKHEAAGRNGFRQQQVQGESQQQNKSQQPVKPKVAAEKGVAEDAKEASGSGGAGRQGKNVQELLTEATGLLKSLSIVKVIRVRSVKVEEEFYGLLDGGATHALRQAREGELKGKEVKEVTVAGGGYSTALATQEHKDAAVSGEGGADCTTGGSGGDGLWHILEQQGMCGEAPGEGGHQGGDEEWVSNGAGEGGA